ncbi:hypothetical protein DAEQUDRAFT_812906 [Daedalea quercina L-15889]|uniref:F-box domain-containing protein n=1 Tax=Daedalea quercina L-15889 TaxID=1314783 RepID=A0A165NTH6_9APHY|nr:hypothetical protein DAEQUDRAFT_812906 [Daedalea quercina L-15889]
METTDTRTRPGSVARVQEDASRIEVRTILDLNDDVLRYILGHMRSCDLIRLAMTSHAAHNLAIPHHLSHVVLDASLNARVFTQNRVALFCKYILADESRAGALRNLSILGSAFEVIRRTWGTGDNYDVAGALHLVFTKAHLLHTLSFSHAASLFSFMPWFPGIVAGLDNLEVLNLGTTYVDTIRALSQSRILTRPASCVTMRLYVHRFMSLAEELGPNTVFPTIEALTIFGEIRGLATIAEKFPNIRTLMVYPMNYLVIDDGLNSTPTGHWHRLDFVSTEMPLPSMRPVRHLRIKYELDDPNKSNGNRKTFGHTEIMLHAMSPVVLDCRGDDTMLNLLQQCGIDLRFIRVITGNKMSKGPVQQVDAKIMNERIVRLAASLGTLPLRGLVFIADVPFVRAQRRRFAKDIAARFELIEYVALGHAAAQTDPYTDHRCQWYRVTRQPGGPPSIKPLKGAEGDKVHNELLATCRPGV